jgi:D-alanyl-D-alanine carboxypeptidase
MSSAYRKPHTPWQRAVALTRRMAHTARARPEELRSGTLLLAGVAVVVATLVGVVGHPTALSSATSLGDVLHSDPTGAVGEADGVVAGSASVLDDDVPAVSNLDQDLLVALRRAGKDAAQDGVELEVNSGWRSPAYQEQLLREAVAKYGSEAEAARWVATSATSPHVSGDAVDVGPSASAWLSRHGADYGLCQIYRNEAWHFELRSEAVGHGCPRMYVDAAHDPRMQR